MTIAALPSILRTSPTFRAEVDTFFETQLPAFSVEAEAARVQIVAAEAAAAASASTATTKATLTAADAVSTAADRVQTELDRVSATASAGTASTQAGIATTKAAEAAASAASVVRDGLGGVAGLTLFKLNLRNAANTFTSWFTTAATAARTWTLPDKDGTVAMTSDITGTNSGTNTGDQTITLTGDVTGTGAGGFAATIAAGAVTLAKLANMATGSVFYRKTAGTGAPEVQTLATLKTDLGLTGTNSGDQTTVTGSAGSVQTTNWKIWESAGYLYCEYGGVKKARLDSAGNIVVIGNVSAYGTI